jgi:cysteinyl-tRNA synthetase
MQEANALLQRFSNFLDYPGAHLDVAAAARARAIAADVSVGIAATAEAAMTWKRWRLEEVALRQALSDCRSSVHAALADDIDTPRVLTALQKLTQVGGLC